MERKLQHFIDSCNMNIFEMITLAIQVASRLYPAELAYHRDCIIESLYGGSNVRGSFQCQTAAQHPPYNQQRSINGKGKDNMKFSGKPATRPKTKAPMIRDLPSQSEPARPVPIGTRRRGSEDAKGKSKLQFYEKPETCLANKTLRISELPSQPRPATPVPIGTRQGQSSAAKGKGKEPCTDFAAISAVGLNKKNNQVKYPAETMPPRKKFGATSNKCLSINDGRIIKKANSNNRGKLGSCSRATKGKHAAAAEIFDYLNLSDDSSDGEKEAEDPLDRWVGEELPNANTSFRDDKDKNDAKLKKPQGSDDA